MRRRRFRTGRGFSPGHWRRWVGEYDLLLVDTPPSGSSALTDAALGCARWLVVPTKADEGSIRGIEDLIRRTVTTTPEDWGPIDILGAALFGVTRAATNVASSARRQLDEWGGGELRIFDTIIPHSDRAAVDLRAMHLLPEEYSALAARSRASRLAALKDGRGPGHGGVAVSGGISLGHTRRWWARCTRR